MFERFTSGARHAVVGAQQVARDLGARRITDAHLLVAVASGDDAAAAALLAAGADRAALLDALGRPDDGLDASALGALGIDLDAVRRQADATFGAGALERAAESVPGRGPRRSPGHLPFTPDAKRILEVALREAVRLGHRRIEAGHLLLAVLRLDASDAHALLRRAGVDTGALDAAITADLRRSAA